MPAEKATPENAKPHTATPQRARSQHVQPAEQLGFDNMPTRLISTTPAKLTTFTDCPRRYRYAYVDRPSPARRGAWAHLSLGTSLHLALRAWWDLPPQRRDAELAHGLLTASWQTDGYRDAEQASRTLNTAADWLRGYLMNLTDTADPVGLERTVAFRTSVVAVSGRADRIDKTDGELTIVDYKSGRRAPSDDDARGSVALALYAIGAARTLRTPCYEVALHHLPTGTVAKHRYTDESLRRQLRRVEETAADIATATESVTSGADRDEAFPAQPGPLCGWCDFYDHCEAGQAAALRQEPWAAVEVVAAPQQRPASEPAGEKITG